MIANDQFIDSSSVAVTLLCFHTIHSLSCLICQVVPSNIHITVLIALWAYLSSRVGLIAFLPTLTPWLIDCLNHAIIVQGMHEWLCWNNVVVHCDLDFSELYDIVICFLSRYLNCRGKKPCPWEHVAEWIRRWTQCQAFKVVWLCVEMLVKFLIPCNVCLPVWDGYLVQFWS